MPLGDKPQAIHVQRSERCRFAQISYKLGASCIGERASSVDDLQDASRMAHAVVLASDYAESASGKCDSHGHRDDVQVHERLHRVVTSDNLSAGLTKLRYCVSQDRGLSDDITRTRLPFRWPIPHKLGWRRNRDKPDGHRTRRALLHGFGRCRQ